MRTPHGRLVARHLPLALLVVLALALHLASSAGLGPGALVTIAGGVAAYVVALRWGCWTWLALLAAAPALLDERMMSLRDGSTVVASAAITLFLATASWKRWPTGGRAIGPAALAAAGAVLGYVAGVATSAHVDAAGVAAPHLPDVLLGAAGVVGVAAGVGVARAAGVPGLRLVCALTVLVPLVAAVAVPSATSGTWHDVPALVTWWPAAGALGITAILRGRRGRASSLPQADSTDEAALAAFADHYGRPALGPVAVVIAAYNEADGIPGVLPTLPDQVCGLHADVIVVDDGSSDGTAEALAGSRALVVACPQNRGQGAALRLGYRVAREHGATYVITTDADGQYDVADFPTVLAPIVEGRADFVSGSRIIGHQHTLDKVRRAGVHVFAWLATVLTGHRLTDTSFGLRAMRSEVTAAVTLNQPQYQSSELLLGVLAHGFRVLEVPGTMHVRAAGASKKGRNLVYGSSYARVMTGTWWREGCPRPVAEVAPALRHTRSHAPR
ncbi:glycosyltransferase family 2 protein [Nocardioides cynanchi]|uniref:glycosyltransferase family 2 protein n=1 Tax=Nocardioides cynanchi TaxID=2558918 RepID=UPI001248371D|nr:glycosyltransferase family 2 protein [Nocardioides cynanchi]